jgi:hypothetical protein
MAFWWLAMPLVLALAPAAGAAPVPPVPIPEGPDAANLPRFIGSGATPNPVSAPQPPRHPFMAPNGRSNLHDDAYMTDTYEVSGPLGPHMQRLTTLRTAECASVTFDSAGRIVTICVGVEGPRLEMFDPDSLDLLASLPLPPRQPAGNPFNDFSGGGYFYLDHLNRAVIPTNNRQIWVVSETGGQADPGFAIERIYDLSTTLLPDDKIFSDLPDWFGRIWFVSQKGVVGTIEPTSGAIKTLPLGEEVTNSFAVDETGSVYIVSDTALYRMHPGSDGTPVVLWREVYQNSGIHKPGQADAGSGTTPTLMGSEYVSITDNADPMNVVVYRRAPQPTGSRLVCEQPVFQQGASATDNSLIGTDTAMVVENNYGYSGPTATINGASTAPGIERVDIDSDGSGCHTVWTSAERAPSVVPKLSLANGLVYTYTKNPEADGTDAWYLAALDFRDGHTVYKRLGGEGFGHNNNYAPITLGPTGHLYVGVLGGLVMLRDREVPSSASPIDVSLVPVFEQCGTMRRPANGGHAPPLGVPSCSPPNPLATASFGPNASSSAELAVLPGNASTAADEADVSLRGSISDVHAGSPAGQDYDPNAGGADMTLAARLRITDDGNCGPIVCSGPYRDPGTATDLDFSVPVDCASTAGSEGALCSWDTSAEAVLPGSIPEGSGTVMQVFRIRVTDAGPNGVRTDSDDRLFAQQGVYIP